MGSQCVWTAWGFVGATALPAVRLDLGPNIRIERVDEQRRAELERSGPRPGHPTLPWPDYFSALPADVVVRSHWAIWLRTTASTLGEAWDDIDLNQVPLAVAALAGFSDMPPRVELLRIGETAPGGRISDAASRWVGATFGGFGTRVLSSPEADTVKARYRAAHRYGVVASRIWHEATVLADQSDGSPRSMANTVLTYFQVIEHIARQESSTGANPTAPDAKAAERVVNRLASDLDGDRLALNAKIRKIRAARDDLDRLEDRFLNQKIAAAGTVLGLDDTVVASALNLAGLRNRALSHPGSELPETLRGWVKEATQTSASFLTAYLDARTKPRP